MGVDALPNSLPHMERGTLRALAITDAKRSRRIPDVPTMGEAVPGYAIDGTIGLGVRPPPARDHRAAQPRPHAGLADPAIKARLFELGADPAPTTPADSAPVSRRRRRNGRS